MATLGPVYTIGHSTRTIAEFAALLQTASVQLVVDIRSFPRSRTNPQFNLDALPNALAPWQLDCVSLPELGGRRGKAHSVAPDVNGFWINTSFHNYADYALSAEFVDGLKSLECLSRKRPCAIMCSMKGSQVMAASRLKATWKTRTACAGERFSSGLSQAGAKGSSSASEPSSTEPRG